MDTKLGQLNMHATEPDFELSLTGNETFGLTDDCFDLSMNHVDLHGFPSPQAASDDGTRPFRNNFANATFNPSDLKLMGPAGAVFDFVDWDQFQSAVQVAQEPSRPASRMRIRPAEADPDEDASDDELTNRLTARYASLKIADNGQLRYYGVTSNLHMLGDQLSTLFQPPVRTTRHDADDLLAQAGLQWQPDSAYEDHLFNLHFTWFQPFMQEVDRDLFFQGRKAYQAGEDASFYSPSLESAM